MYYVNVPTKKVFLKKKELCPYWLRIVITFLTSTIYDFYLFWFGLSNCKFFSLSSKHSLTYLLFSIMFSGIFKNNMYIKLWIHKNIEICNFKIWQNCIRKFKWERTKTKLKERIWSLWKSYSSSILNISVFFFNKKSCYSLSNKVSSQVFLMAS